ncbi:MAG: hypothetical protein ACRDDY_03685 [Clostridium sp.]|uniref:hypothetical protein n=1 Tax=Clostridium sp. TaxID=1506 RepID=UPI003EE7CA6D
MKKIILGILLLSNIIFAKEFIGKVIGITDTGGGYSTRLICVNSKGEFISLYIGTCIFKDDIMLADITKMYVYKSKDDKYKYEVHSKLIK